MKAKILDLRAEGIDVGRCLDGVDTANRFGYDIAGVVDEVVSLPGADEGVSARSAVEGVVARAADHDVASGIARTCECAGAGAGEREILEIGTEGVGRTSVVFTVSVPAEAASVMTSPRCRGVSVVARSADQRSGATRRACRFRVGCWLSRSCAGERGDASVGQVLEVCAEAGGECGLYRIGAAARAFVSMMSPALSMT